MATPTYELIDSRTIAGNTASVTFSSIPSTFRDLVLVIDATATENGTVLARFNGDTGGNYAHQRIQGAGSASAFKNNNINQLWEQSADSNRNQFIMQIVDYSATDKHKSVLTRHNRANFVVWAIISVWKNTSAITSISFAQGGGGSYTSGSTFKLFGIAG